MSFVPSNCNNARNMPGDCPECGRGICRYNRDHLREYIAGTRKAYDVSTLVDQPKSTIQRRSALNARHKNMKVSLPKIGA